MAKSKKGMKKGVKKEDLLKPEYPKIQLKDFSFTVAVRDELDQIYQETLGNGLTVADYRHAANAKGLSKLVYRTEAKEKAPELVGGVCCRAEGKAIYVGAIARKKKYDGEGIGRKMMYHILDYVGRHKRYTRIYGHVETTNKNAIGFYEHFNLVRRPETVPNHFGDEKPAYIYEYKIVKKNKK